MASRVKRCTDEADNRVHLGVSVSESLRLRIVSWFLVTSRLMIQPSSTRLSILRAGVVIAALFSLCVSSNVGPCFLPLPPLEIYSAENLQKATGATASRSHSTASAGFRVPMAQAQKRADRELSTRSLAVPPGIDFVVPNQTRIFAELTDSDPLYVEALASLPSGRAPPRSI